MGQRGSYQPLADGTLQSDRVARVLKGIDAHR